MIDLLLNNLDLILDADGDGKRVRDAILQLAVRGRLVAQEAGDEDARTILDDVIRARHLGMAKRRHKAVEVGDIPEEYVRGLPKGWCAARLGDFSSHDLRAKVDSANVDGDLRTVELEDIPSGSAGLVPRVQFRDRPTKSTKCQFEAGDVLYGKLRPYLDKVMVAPESGVCTTEIVPIVALGGIYPEWMWLLLRSPNFRDYATRSSYGVKMPRLGTGDLVNSVHWLPPLAEQHRIVAKVDELMGHAAVVEERHLAATSARVRFRDAALHALAEAEDHEAVEAAWSRIEDHFDDLFTEPEDIQPLRQTILQLAVRGRLVAQEAGDEDAGSVLDAVARQREGLVSRGELKRPRFSSVQENCEGPFSLATGWVWAPLEHVCLDVSDGVHKTPTYVDSGVPFLSIKDLSGGEISFSDCRYITREAYEDMIRRSRPMPGDILFCRIGTLGNPVVIDTAQEFGIFVSLGLLKAASDVSSHYLRAVLDSPYAYATYEQVKAGGSHASKLNLGTMRELPIPVPPLAEQYRIVAKVDELMALCDTLETSLKQAKTTREQFATSISHALTGPTAASA